MRLRRVWICGSALVLLAAGGCGTQRSGGARDGGSGDILFVRGGADGGIFSMTADGEEARLLVPRAGQPVWSPDGTRIAFAIGQRPRGGGEPRSSVWVADADGRNRKRVTRSARASSPAWSPDGTLIAFVGDGGIHVVRPDGTDERVLSFEPTLANDLSWSPSGRELAADGGLGGLVAVRADGSGERRLTRQFNDAEPAWSPDGRWIAFTRSHFAPKDRRDLLGDHSLHVVRADGTQERRLTSGADDFEPSWSPDSTSIVFVRFPKRALGRDDGDALAELYVIGRDGSGLRRLTDNRVFDGSPAWRPAGTTQPPPATLTTADAAARVTVPRVTGLLLPAATQRLRAAGLAPRRPKEAADRYARLQVFAQSPRAGVEVAAGTHVQLAVLDVSNPFAGRRFDRAVWLRNRSCDAENNPRARMYDDLARNHLRRGMSRAAVRRLLGEPAPGRAAAVLEYPLGYASGFKIDCDYLYVEFDRSGRLRRVSHYQS